MNIEYDGTHLTRALFQFYDSTPALCPLSTPIPGGASAHGKTPAFICAAVTPGSRRLRGWFARADFALRDRIIPIVDAALPRISRLPLERRPFRA